MVGCGNGGSSNRMTNFVSIESLRAYMAWWVVLGHASHLVGARSFLPQPLVNIIEHANIAVDVFIMISGFVIAHLTISRREQYIPYIIRRAFRLFPVYLFCLLLAIGVSRFYLAAYSLPWAFGSEMRMERAGLEQEHFWEYLFLHLPMVHGIIPDSIIPYSSSAFLAPAWSLSLEWQFYLVAPALVWLLARSAWPMLITVALMIASMAGAQSGLIGEWHYSSFLPLAFHYFLIGILSRIVLGDPQLKKAGAETFVILGAAIATLAGPLEAAIWVTFLAIAMTELDMISIRVPLLNRLNHIFVLNPTVARIGAWSFSTYLIHLPIFSLLVGSAALHNRNVAQSTVVALVLLSFPLTLVASWLSYTFIEQKFNRVGRQIANKVSMRSQKDLAAAG